MIYINTETGEYPIEEVVVRSRFPNTSFPNEFEYGPYVPVIKTLADYNRSTSYLNEILPPEEVDGIWYQRWEILPLTDDAIATSTKSMNDKRISVLWQYAHDMEYSEINGAALALLTIGVINKLPKSLAIKTWINTIWNEYYLRKADVNGNIHAWNKVPFPHTIPELMAEVESLINS